MTKAVARRNFGRVEACEVPACERRPDNAIAIAIVRLDPGDNPPATALAEIYEPPAPGYSPRGMDIGASAGYWPARPPPANTAPKGGRFIPSQDRNSRA